jgi:hypothetical protein
LQGRKREIISSCKNYRAYTSGRETVKIFDAADNEISNYSSKMHRIVDLVFSGDGSKIAAFGFSFTRSYFMGWFYLWPTITFDGNSNCKFKLGRKDREFNSVAFNHDGTIIAVGSYENDDSRNFFALSGGIDYHVEVIDIVNKVLLYEINTKERLINSITLPSNDTLILDEYVLDLQKGLKILPSLLDCSKVALLLKICSLPKDKQLLLKNDTVDYCVYETLDQNIQEIISLKVADGHSLAETWNQFLNFFK